MKRNHSGYFLFVAILLLALFSLSLPGCGSLLNGSTAGHPTDVIGSADVAAATAAQVLAQAKTQLAAAQTQLAAAQATAATQPTDPAVTKSLSDAAAQLGKWTAAVEKFSAIVDSLKPGLDRAAAATQTSDTVAGVVQTAQAAAAAIPSPYTPLIELGLGLAGGVVLAILKDREAKAANATAATATAAATSIVTSIQAAQDAGHITLTPQAKAVLDAVQTPAAKALVDSVQSK